VQAPWVAGVVVAACVLLSQGVSAAFPTRPSWMPEAPPLLVAGHIVEVATVEELDAAVRGAADGDTIMVADGTYQLSRVLHLRGKSNVTIRGASGDPAKVVIRGSGWDEADEGFDLLVIQGCSDVTVAHVSFTEGRSYGIKLENLLFEGRGLKNINIYDCHFSNIGVRAIKGTGGDRQPLEGGSIRYCTFENTRVPPRTWIYDGDYISAIDCMRLKDWEISDNSFRNIKGANGGGRGAIFVWVESQNVITERNVFVNCDRSICYGNPSGSSEHAARHHNTGGIIRNNFIVAGVDTGIEICWAKGVKVYHNTVLADAPGKQAGIHYHWQDISDISIANNIVRGRIFGDEGGVAKENNLTEGIEDAWFRDAADGDLHLTEAAAAAMDRADRLADCPTDFDGGERPAEAGKADLGADEYAAGD
jgi:hypothetical protein